MIEMVEMLFVTNPLVQVLLYVSAAFMFIGAVGLLRFPDLYTRIHAATMVTVGGVCLSLLLLAATTFWSVYSLKIVVVVIFTLITSPTISHALANTAYKLDIKPKRLITNELGEKGVGKEEEL